MQRLEPRVAPAPRRAVERAWPQAALELVQAPGARQAAAYRPEAGPPIARTPAASRGVARGNKGKHERCESRWTSESDETNRAASVSLRVCAWTSQARLTPISWLFAFGECFRNAVDIDATVAKRDRATAKTSRHIGDRSLACDIRSPPPPVVEHARRSACRTAVSSTGRTRGTSVDSSWRSASARRLVRA